MIHFLNSQACLGGHWKDSICPTPNSSIPKFFLPQKESYIASWPTIEVIATVWISSAVNGGSFDVLFATRKSFFCLARIMAYYSCVNNLRIRKETKNYDTFMQKQHPLLHCPIKVSCGHVFN